MDFQELLLIALRASFVYLFLLLVVRILGKREIGNITAFDLIVSLILGDVVDEVIYGDVTVIEGIAAITIIAIWHLFNSWASFKSRIIENITAASPTTLVEHGKIQRKNLARERLSEEDLFSELRLMEVDKIEEVKRATLEPNGQVSVLLEEWAKPVQRQDISTNRKARKS
jgi:uncharacterized membrane protein YcaP (DUF421 family)